MMPDSAELPIPISPPPWTCKCTAYTVPFFPSASKPLPQSKILAPLEANSETWTSPAIAGQHKGGLGIAQVLRYTETPVGSYDELCIMPGHFATPENLDIKPTKYLRITGIWVSQETTCANGRKLWNIPKHIANFRFTQTSTDPLPLRVEISNPGSSTPFFVTTIHKTSYTPTFSLNSEWNGYMGLPKKCLQPPLPTGDPSRVELGTEEWLLCAPVLKSKKARFVWCDMEQPAKATKSDSSAGQERAATDGAGDDKNWWPGMGKWRIGIELKEAILTLGEPEVLREKSQ